MPSVPQIDYDALAQDAMRGVVRAVLERIAATGLPGDHHFYIAFAVRAPGVSISKRLREKYPDEMTIVLQHRFWDLLVDQDQFQVKLTFDGIPERLVVPFKAIKVFLDPSVQYGLQFGEAGPEPMDASTEVGHETGRQAPTPRDARPTEGAPARADTAQPAPRRSATGEVTEKKRPGPRRARAEKAQPAPGHAGVDAPAPAAAATVVETSTASTGKEAATTHPASTPAPAEPIPAQPGAKVVQLEVFRQKKK